MKRIDSGTIWNKLKRGILNLVYPQGVNCLVCGDPRRAVPGYGVCATCLAKLKQERVPPESCERCLSYVPRRGPCPFCSSGRMKGIDACYAPFRYMPVSRKLVISIKFGGSNEAAALLGREMANALTGRDFDAIIPVPLHPLRRRERGINQAELLADEVSRQTGIAVVNGILQRSRYTKAQSSLSIGKRDANVKGAFEIAPQVDLQREIEGKRFLLVDDVRTSGNTARSCAEVLRACRAESVCLLTACIVWSLHEKTIHPDRMNRIRK